ncbi:hypothetical protein BST61_g2073 [Cercospora zeina]
MFGLFHLAAISAAALCASALPQQVTPGTVDPNFVCPAADMERTHCMGGKDCLYPLPGNCGGYIQCQPKDTTYQTGIAYEMPCPAGLLWNDNQKWCDYPENSTCGTSQSPSGSAPAPDSCPFSHKN